MRCFVSSDVLLLKLAFVGAVAGVGLTAAPAHAAWANTWGLNDYGQLGNGTTNNSSTPVLVSGLSSGVTAIAGGYLHSVAVQSGAVYAWGDNDYGQLGNGTFADSSTPVAVSGLSSGVTAVAAGQLHSIALQNGGVYAWGWNFEGQLGNGTTTISNTPVAASGLSSGVTAIAAGAEQNLAIQNGGVYAWGSNYYGQLGNGTFANSYSTPVAVSGLSSGVTAISTATYDSFAVQNGGLYAWGSDPSGQLGTASGNGSETPVAVSGLSAGVTAISAGYSDTLAVRNGAVYAWGYNDAGQLGDGTTTNRSTPEQIDPTDLTDIVSVAAGGASSYALSSDGSLWVWGDNTYGELGLGSTTTDYLTPQLLLPPSGYVFTSIAASEFGNFTVATLAAAPVPEPAAVSLLVIGGIGLLRRRSLRLPALRSAVTGRQSFGPDSGARGRAAS